MTSRKTEKDSDAEAVAGDESDCELDTYMSGEQALTRYLPIYNARRNEVYRFIGGIKAAGDSRRLLEELEVAAKLCGVFLDFSRLAILQWGSVVTLTARRRRAWPKRVVFKLSQDVEEMESIQKTIEHMVKALKTRQADEGGSRPNEVRRSRPVNPPSH